MSKPMPDRRPQEQWFTHLLDIRGSVVSEISLRVSVFGAWAAVVVLAHEYVCRLHIPPTVHSLVGLALGLLLVFRTNSSYDRFWEGRKQWGAIVNESRNLGRLAHAHLAAAPELRDALLRWTCSFAWATMHRLRGTSGLGPLAEGLPPEETRAVLAAHHPPFAASLRLTAVLAEARRRGLLSEELHRIFEQNVGLLVDYLGACERIRNTALPFAYVVHLRRGLILYCFTLPNAIVNDFGWGTIVATLMAAYTFFGIEEIGVEIEDPFGTDDNDLPLEDICSGIERNLGELLATR